MDVDNHRLVNSEQVTWLRSNRGMTAGQQVEAIEYALGRLRTYQIMEVMEEQLYGGEDKAEFVKRDPYNFFVRYKRIRRKDAQFLLNVGAF